MCHLPFSWLTNSLQNAVTLMENVPSCSDSEIHPKKTVHAWVEMVK
jgi:hypothetical protein